MKVRFKRGWWRTYGTLTPGNVYRVIGIEADQLRLLDDLGEPVLFIVHAFDFVDPTEPSDWISEYLDGLHYAYPAELAAPGFFEAWHDGDRDARSRLTTCMHRICWREAEALEDAANTYLRVRWKHNRSESPVTLYSELDEERWEVRKVEVFADGRMTFADGRRASGDTMLGEVPLPALEAIAADPEFEAATISRAEFEAVWTDVAYRDLDD